MTIERERVRVWLEGETGAWVMPRRFLRPCRELDAIVYWLFGHAPDPDRTVDPYFDAGARYSRYLPAALTVADEMTGFALEAINDLPAIYGVRGWRCDLEWDADLVREWRERSPLRAAITLPLDEGVSFGRGEDPNPAMAIMKAVLDMYCVDVQDVPEEGAAA